MKTRHKACGAPSERETAALASRRVTSGYLLLAPPAQIWNSSTRTEQTATINDGTGVLWTTKYTYTNFNAIATREDARRVVTTYTYDGINRLIGTSYNTSGALGVASTPAVGYSYDTTQSSPTNGLLLSVGTGGYQETYGYDTYKRLNSLTRTIDSTNYATSYNYNIANQVSQITYPSNRVVNINYDSVGRVSSLTDVTTANYLSGVGYDVGGKVTGLTLGNGVVENYGYDANRLQLTSQTATSGATSLMNLTYNYQATAGQNGAGSTTGNTGQLMSISGSIGGVNESASFSYDLQNRLVTSSQTTNAVTAEREYRYDRWGNRGNVYIGLIKATQTLHQSPVLEQSGGVPTNRLTSVTSSGVTRNYTYDAAGNVTNDGTHTFQYDGENRVVSVDGGVTASYSYDQNNRRVKKTVGVNVTHYVWEGSQVIAEHDGVSGAVMTEYVYSGSRMIARFTGGVSRYYLSDRLSARLTLDGSGVVVGRQATLPFGEELNATGTTDKHRFTSYERDGETGTDYAVNRLRTTIFVSSAESRNPATKRAAITQKRSAIAAMKAHTSAPSIGYTIAKR